MLGGSRARDLGMIRAPEGTEDRVWRLLAAGLCARRRGACGRRPNKRTSYRPGELLQFDLFEPRREISVGHGQSRRGYVLTAELGYSRAIAGALVFSKEWDNLAFGMTRCLTQLGALPETLVWDREGAIHGGGGQPTDAFAAFCGELRVGWLILEARDPEAKGALERSQFMRTNFEPGRSFANELDYQHQLDARCAQVNARVHRTTRAVVAERLAEEREQMRPLPGRMPDPDRRFVVRVAAQHSPRQLQRAFEEIGHRSFSEQPRSVRMHNAAELAGRAVIDCHQRRPPGRLPEHAALRDRGSRTLRHHARCLSRPRPCAPVM